MKQRSVIAVILLSIVTFGIYPLYLLVTTKGEMNNLGANIPTALLIIVPLVNLWWLWKYSEGVEKVTNGKMQGIVAFLLLWFLGGIGQAIIQDSFNKISAAPTMPVAPVATAATAAPAAPTIPAAPTQTVQPTIQQPTQPVVNPGEQPPNTPTPQV